MILEKRYINPLKNIGSRRKKGTHMVMWFSTKIQRQLNGERIVFITNDSKRTKYLYAKKINLHSTSYMKDHSKWITNVNIKVKSKNFLTQSIEKKIFVICGIGKDFLDMKPKHDPLKKNQWMRFQQN